ncbi:MAG: hypothetical protein JJ913_05305 [Rhizobiaceae bacterium]|nr:hypothetical protein [Rhizobiaceae bacterium]
MTPNLILSILSGEAGAVARRARKSAIEYLVAGAAAAVGFGFLLLAAYIYAARFYGELAVAIAFGAIFLALAVALLIYHRIMARARARRARERMSGEAMTLAATVAVAALPSLLSKKGALAGIAIPVVSAIAYAIYRENKGGDGDDDLTG